jgi:hypothetical protein
MSRGKKKRSNRIKIRSDETLIQLRRSESERHQKIRRKKENDRYIKNKRSKGYKGYQ